MKTKKYLICSIYYCCLYIVIFLEKGEEKLKRLYCGELNYNEGRKFGKIYINYIIWFREELGLLILPWTSQPQGTQSSKPMEIFSNG